MVVNGHFSRGREGGALVVEVGPKSLFIISDNFSFTALLTLPTTSTIHHHLLSLFHQSRIGVLRHLITVTGHKSPEEVTGLLKNWEQWGRYWAIGAFPLKSNPVKNPPFD